MVILRNIFGPIREEAAEGWRKLCDEKLQYLYTTPNTGSSESRCALMRGVVSDVHERLYRSESV